MCCDVTHLQATEGVVQQASDVISCQVKNAEMFKSLKHVSCHQVDPVPIQSQLQQLALVLERARLHSRDGVVL